MPVLSFSMKILLSAFTGLGNFVLKTPMIQAWTKLYPDDEIHLLAGNAFGAEFVLHRSPLISKTHFISVNASGFEKFAFFRSLRAEKFDVAVLPFDAQPNFLVAGTYIARIPLRIRHLHPAVLSNRFKAVATIFLSTKTHLVPVLAGRHETDLNMDLLRAYHRQPVTDVFPTIVNWQEHPEVLSKYNLQSNQYLLIQPGAANGLFKVKAWPPQHFGKLISQLHENFSQYKIVLVGDQGDLDTNISELYQYLPEKVKSVVINTAGETNIPDLLTLIKGASLIVCHDSGTMHLADALEKPLIALYGPTDFSRTRPLKPTSTVLFAKGNYFNAMYNFKYTESELSEMGIGYEAMANLSVDEVLKSITDKLQ